MIQIQHLSKGEDLKHFYVADIICSKRKVDNIFLSAPNEI